MDFSIPSTPQFDAGEKAAILELARTMYQSFQEDHKKKGSVWVLSVRDLIGIFTSLKLGMIREDQEITNDHISELIDWANEAKIQQDLLEAVRNNSVLVSFKDGELAFGLAREAVKRVGSQGEVP
jgi:hypothetical protein